VSLEEQPEGQRIATAVEPERSFAALPSHAGDHPRLALAVTAMSAILALLAGLWLYGGPVGQQREGGGRPAALVFRDRVPAYQELVSSTLSRSLFEDRYEHFEYITQKDLGHPQELLSRLEPLLQGYQQVDLFLLAHSNGFAYDVATLDPRLTRHLRLVYDTGCGDARQGPTWLALGADAYVGHAAPLSLSPLFYLYFARQWAGGATVAEAAREANRRATSRLEFFGLSSSRYSAQGTVFGDGDIWLGGRAP
jgi:hypothetical protein